MADAPMDQTGEARDADLVACITPEPETPFPAWEQIETGRFMPRRVRGSFRGGVLG
jgi:hypothetical protein